MSTEVRNDLHLTSTGKGHYYSPSHGFPSDRFRRTVYDVLPPVLGNPDYITDNEHFRTTTGSTHDYKVHGRTLGNTLFKKAPGSWKVRYVEDNSGKLSVKPWRKPLTMGNQSSEMQSQYTGQPGVNLDTVYNAGIQPFNLADHHSEGNSKDLVPSTINRGVAGQKFYPRDRGVLTYHMDPYLTTTQRDHRAFTKHELGRYPSKDYATYWECEEYPKAWGHGSKENPLPLNTVPQEKGPLRDRIWFREPTTIPRLPKSLEPVPNKGMQTLMTESYTMPPERKRQELFSMNVPKPWHAPLESPGPSEKFQVPRMYNTEYQFYGSEKPVTV